jgi:IMP dehydrogenase
MNKSYCFDDVLMDPLLSNIKSRSSIDLSTNIAKYPRELWLKSPYISSCMSTITESQMAIEMALNGGIGIIHRYLSIDKQVEEVRKVKKYQQFIINDPYTILDTDTLETYMFNVKKYGKTSYLVINNDNKLVGIITKRDTDDYINQLNIYIKDLMTPLNNDSPTIIKYNNLFDSLGMSCDIDSSLNELSIFIFNKYKIEKIPIVNNDFTIKGLITKKNININSALDNNGRLLVGAAIGIKNEYNQLQRLNMLVNAGIDLVCIDVANGYNTNVGEFIIKIRNIYPTLVIMAGNVCNREGFEYLDKCGADCIRVGIGSGSICTTRLQTGIGKGQWSAVNECYNYIREVKNDNEQFGNRYHAVIISDGGTLGKTGNKAKALATGASAIMLGRTLAGTMATPGIPITKDGKKCKYFRGMASTVAHLETNDTVDNNFNPEGVDGFVEIKEDVINIIKGLNGGIRSCMSYLGVDNIASLHHHARNNLIKFSLVTPIGMTETFTRGGCS